MQTPFTKQQNNFDAIRLALAVLVIYSHSYPLAANSYAGEAMVTLTRGQTSSGGMAVGLFFVISGFLITASYERSTSVATYLFKRIRRIYPAFAAVNLLSLLIVLPLSGGHLMPGTHLDHLTNLVIQTLRLQGFDCTGVFPSNPVPDALNGSMWSLAFEFWCYLLIIVLGLIGVLRSRVLMTGLLAASLAWSVVVEVHHVKPYWGAMQWWLGYPALWAQVLPPFLAGIVFYRFRAHLSMRPAWIAAGAAMFIAAMVIPHGWAALFPVAGGYLTLVVAYHPAIRLHGWSRYGDFSYGTYLYAFPVQQLLMRWIGHPVSHWRLFLLATPIALLCAAASWHGVEKWFLKPALGNLVERLGWSKMGPVWRDLARD
jgi:peptidoglycan/LPS O-acetylase OafA/YrhL